MSDFTTQLAKAMCVTAYDFDGAWEDARIDHERFMRYATAALEFLTAAGRLIPPCGMALTAEQVEDVRAAREELRGYRNFTGYGRSHVNQLIAAVDALFPATEPAEEVKPVHPKPDVGDWGYGGGAAVYAPEVRGKTREELLSEKVEQLQAQVKHLSRVAVNAAEHGIKAPSGSLKPCGYCHSTEATLLHACTNCGAMTSDPWSHPTSAVPAEEETKAEEWPVHDSWCTGTHGRAGNCIDTSRWIDPPIATAETHMEKMVRKGSIAKFLERTLVAGDGWHLPTGWDPGVLAGAIVYGVPASSPVVPAPTEPVYVNVPTWQEVPEGITYHPEGRPEGFVNRGGQPYYLGMSKPLSATFEQLEDFMQPQGPFYFIPAPTETGPWA